MISCFASGFIAEKPAVLMVSANQCKCEFTVLWSRPVRRDGVWETVWERAVFVAWDEEAERVASRLDKGSRVTCTGTQETSSWLDGASQQRRYKTIYRLASWSVEHQSRPKGAHEGSSGHGQSSRSDYPNGGGRSAPGRHAGQDEPSKSEARYRPSPARSAHGNPQPRDHENDSLAGDGFIEM